MRLSNPQLDENIENYLSLQIRMGENQPSGPLFIGSIDQGTTSSRFLTFNEAGDPVASYQIEFKQIYPQPGWHEHDPLEIISSVEKCIDSAVTDFTKQGHFLGQIKAIGITNQRETTVLWNQETGEPLYNAIVWTDTRTQSLVRALKERLGADKILERVGVPLSTYPSIAFGTIDSWLVYKLNGGPKKNVFVTDASNASRTMLMNIYTLQYDEAVIDFFRLDTKKVHLPKIIRSSHPNAYGCLESTVLKGFPITGCLGDQSAALVGQKGFTPGMAKNTYGTGCFLLYNIGTTPVISTHGLLTTVAYDFGGKPMYALEGSIAVAGSSVKFLVDNFGFTEASDKISALAETVPDNGGCTFVTAFSGLFAPYWIDDARGTIFGITAFTKRGHVARATLEATCFQTKAILDAMEKDCKHKLAELAVDGGMCNSDLTMQTQSDLINIPVNRPAMRETTAVGAAIAAGLAAKVWASVEEVRHVNTEGRTVFKPQILKEERGRRLLRWTKAVEMSKGWASC
ncbi:hypothetical protein VF21_10306 [Pseudogymnoascus sp. 05NY08]|nr:hypothetical protein VF21_10306 [Pseudogymnoascus sp. 05NY08]